MIYYMYINHIFCKERFDKFCPASKSAQDLKDDYD